MVRSASVVAVVLLGVGCKGADGKRSLSLDAANAAPAASTADAAFAQAPSASAAVDVSAPAAAKGTATLVVQRVETECATGPGEVHKSLLGHDVLVEVVLEGEKKARKVFPLCPAVAVADGGVALPRLDTWEACHVFPSCAIVSSEGGAEGRAEVTCGKETFVLENGPGGTVVKGSFGERVVSPAKSTIAPPKRTSRTAWIDC